MIQSFAGRDTQAVFERKRVRRLPPDIHRRAHRKLLTLHAANSLEDTNVPPGNRLHPLGGDRAGQHAIWINDQWRICFRWHDGNAYDVEIADYHDESFFWGKRARAQMTGSELIETYPPVHPGEILQDEFMEPHGLSAYSLAAELGVDHMRIYRITRGEQTVTTDTALRLSRFFGTTARFWLNLQDHYDLEVAARDEGVQRSLEKIRRIRMEDPAPQHGEVR